MKNRIKMQPVPEMAVNMAINHRNQKWSLLGFKILVKSATTAILGIVNARIPKTKLTEFTRTAFSIWEPESASACLP